MPIRNDYKQTPPHQPVFVPEIQYPTPNINDVVIVEDVPMTKAGYRPLLPGTPRHNDTTAILVWQGQVKASNNEVMHRRIYATVRSAQDAYNAATQYVSDDASSPIYIRQYIESRDTYTRGTSLTALTGIIRLVVTDGGTGYTSASVVSFSGGGGTGAAATAEITGGVLVALLITNTGSGYTSAPTVAISVGSGATATAYIQPATALLIKEESTPAPGELASRFLAVTRIYQTLPGPILYEDVYDVRRGPVQRTTQLIAFSSLAASLTSDGSTVTETTYQPVSAPVLRKTVETWAFSTAPIFYEDVYDVRRGPVQIASQYINYSSLAASLASDGSTVTETSYKPVNAVVLDKAIETWAFSAAPILTQDIYDPWKGAVQVTSQYVTAGGSEVGSISGSFTETSYKPVNVYVLDKTIETWAVGSVPIHIRYDTDDETHEDVTITEQLIAAPANYTALGNSAGVLVSYHPINSSYGKKTSLSIGTPASRTEYKMGPYRYPPLVLVVTGSGVEARDGTVSVAINWERRAARTRNVQHKIVITYGDSATLVTSYGNLTIFDPVLNDLIYDGHFIRANEQGVLNDTITASYTTGTTNAKWPYIAETMTFAASDLTATEWLALEDAYGGAGTEKIVNAVLSPWKYNLWRLEVFYVTIKNWT